MECCSVELFASVELGHSFVIGGKATPGAKSFEINFCGEKDEINVIIDIANKRAVVKTKEDDLWGGSEEVKLHCLESGGRFKLSSIVSEFKLKMTLNGTHVIDYPCMTMIPKLRKVKVSGDLEFVNQVDHRRVFPSAWPPLSDDLDHITFSSDVPYQFSPGSVIVLRMGLLGSPKGAFFIRFNEHASKRQLVQFNPRFKDKIVSVNSMNDSLE